MNTLDVAVPSIDVPVLIALGSHDLLMCGIGATDCTSDATVMAAEAPHFSPAARLQVFVLSGAGHAINLELNAPTWFAAAAAWARTFIGT